jgi:hypothetical protein
MTAIEIFWQQIDMARQNGDDTDLIFRLPGEVQGAKETASKDADIQFRSTQGVHRASTATSHDDRRARRSKPLRPKRNACVADGQLLSALRAFAKIEGQGSAE